MPRFVRPSLLSLVLLILPESVVASSTGTPPRSTPSASAPNRFLRALQARNWNEVLELTAGYQEVVSSIRGGNPKTLWPRLIGEYRDTVRSGLAKEQYPIASLRDVAFLVVPTCIWRITETRIQDVDSFAFGRHKRLTAFVDITYSREDRAPIVDGRALKHTVVSLAFRAENGLFLEGKRLTEGDAFWSTPQLENGYALSLIENAVPWQRLNAYIEPIIAGSAEGDSLPWFNVHLPTYTTPELSWLVAFLEKRRFRLQEFVIKNGWGMNGGRAQPPTSWKAFQLPADDNKTARFSLNERPELSVAVVNNTDTKATAVLHVKRTGCTEACEMVKEYWAHPIAGLAEWSGFFDVRWDGIQESGGLRGSNWPTEAERVVVFKYRPGQGWSYESDKLVMGR
jgi:hypothetical protein